MNELLVFIKRDVEAGDYQSAWDTVTELTKAMMLRSYRLAEAVKLQVAIKQLEENGRQPRLVKDYETLLTAVHDLINGGK